MASSEGRLTVASAAERTILRPALLTEEDEVDYEFTEKGRPFKGKLACRRSVGDPIR